MGTNTGHIVNEKVPKNEHQIYKNVNLHPTKQKKQRKQTKPKQTKTKQRKQRKQKKQKKLRKLRKRRKRRKRKNKQKNQCIKFALIKTKKKTFKVVFYPVCSKSLENIHILYYNTIEQNTTHTLILIQYY